MLTVDDGAWGRGVGNLPSTPLSAVLLVPVSSPGGAAADAVANTEAVVVVDGGKVEDTIASAPEAARSSLAPKKITLAIIVE